MGVWEEPGLCPQGAPKEQKTGGFKVTEATGHHERGCEGRVDTARTGEVHSDLLEATSDW